MRLLRALAVATALGSGLQTPAAAHDLGEQAEELGDALRDFLQEMEPALEDALEWFEELQAIDDPRNYLMPEVLPNGDIIIRRRPDAPPYVPKPEEPDDLPVPEGGTVDL